MEKLTKYELEMAEKTKTWSNGSLLIFRGQSDANWELNSSAERRIERIKSSSKKPGMIEYLTKRLIEPAKKEGYGRQKDRDLNDLELLASLQHQGAATCLIDFTANFHLALWFACQNSENPENSEKDGVVFVVNRGDIQTFREVTPDQAKKGIEKLLKGQTDTPESTDDPFSKLSALLSPKIYYWKPPPNENRIVIQHSCFIFSSDPIGKKVYEKMTICKDDKKAIRDLLEKCYGLNMQTIFRDLTGFASSHGQDSPIDISNLPTAEDHFKMGSERLRRSEYDLAFEGFTQAIKLNPDYAEAYYNRGTAYAAKGDLVRAIADFKIATELKQGLSKFYYARGNAYAAKGDPVRALADYYEAMKLEPNLLRRLFSHLALPRYSNNDFVGRKAEAALEAAQTTEGAENKFSRHVSEGFCRCCKRFEKAIGTNLP